LTILKRAVSRTREPLRIFLSRTMSAWSTASPTLRDHWSQQGAVFEEIEVTGITSADLIREYDVPHYAKVDIEGSDLICLKGFQEAGGVPDFVSVEVDFNAIDDLIEVLTDMGFRRFALVGQKEIAGQTAPAIASEGRSVSYVFKSGCSGLFGRELQATWTHTGRLRAQCKAVIKQHRLSGLLNRLNKVRGFNGPIDRLKQSRLPLAQDWYDIHAAM
jgi:hypothetical protein